MNPIENHVSFLLLTTAVYIVFTGMAEPNKACEEGHYCRRNAKSGTPDQSTDANICPQGHYCPNGTGEPDNCPKGTLNNRTGMLECLHNTSFGIIMAIHYPSSELQKAFKLPPGKIF